MLYKTKGIVLNYIRFKESSIIVRIYTEQFGIQNYIVNSVRSSAAKSNKIALFQPLTQLDLVVYHKENKPDAIHRISEVRCNYPYHSLPFDIIKTTIGLFITEILTKTLKEEEENLRLYQFLEQSLKDFDKLDAGAEYYPLQFMTRFSFYLGFGLESVKDLEGQLDENTYPIILDEKQRKAVQRWLLDDTIGATYPLNKQQRLTLLQVLLFYYKVHIVNFGELKSAEILHSVFS